MGVLTGSKPRRDVLEGDLEDAIFALGVAFTGISPRDVAWRVAEFLALKEACAPRR